MDQMVNQSAEVIFVGMNPSAKQPRKGSTRNKLAEWAEEMRVDSYDFINVIDQPGEVHHSMVDYKSLTFTLKQYRRVIALGNFVSDVLKRSDIEHFKLPHPSPRNRMLNNPEKISAILQECAKYTA
jgi:G:T/U-mismatch repair DNA glycosylase